LARKFLYFVASMVILVLAGAFVYQVYGEELMEVAFVPDTEFAAQEVLETNVYADTAMWLARPELVKGNPALWLPEGYEDAEDAFPKDKKAAVFFVHPTSFMKKNRWNATLDDEESQTLARIFLRGQASAFNAIGDVWAPRYRQATLGAFLTTKPQGQQALDAAYQDVLAAFDYFVAEIPGQPGRRRLCRGLAGFGGHRYPGNGSRHLRSTRSDPLCHGLAEFCRAGRLRPDRRSLRYDDRL
jgi:hypothetical protein